MIKIFISYFFLCSFNFIYAEEYGLSTGYKLPRFVSLKSNEVNLRVGSSRNYPIILKYISKNLPVEIVDENNTWRKIRDIEGNEGWILEGLLQGDRYAIINQSYIPSVQIFSHPEGRVIGKIGKKNIVKINSCLTNWCKIEYKKYRGWINKRNLWGVYEKEKFNISFFQPLVEQVWKIKF